MDGWMDNGGTDKWMDGWIMEEQINGWMDNEGTDKWMDG